MKKFTALKFKDNFWGQFISNVFKYMKKLKKFKLILKTFFYFLTFSSALKFFVTSFEYFRGK